MERWAMVKAEAGAVWGKYAVASVDVSTTQTVTIHVSVSARHKASMCMQSCTVSPVSQMEAAVVRRLGDQLRYRLGSRRVDERREVRAAHTWCLDCARRRATVCPGKESRRCQPGRSGRASARRHGMTWPQTRRVVAEQNRVRLSPTAMPHVR